MPCRLHVGPRLALLLVVGGALALGGAVSPPSEALACALVSRAGAPRVKGEEALIIWQPEAGLQHFVRKAGFDGASADFGFLVPTPSRPELGEANASVFEHLFALYRQREPRSRSRRGGGASGRSVDGAGSVTVVERRVVAGLDAAVLAADDAGALEGWLREHGFLSGAALRAWLGPYVARGFFVTAFRYAPAETGVAFSSANVRMTFATDVPYYPYAEPRSQRRGGARPFRLSVIAPYRVEAREGPRRARIGAGYAAHLPAASFERVLRNAAVPGLRLPSDGAWLTVFDEARSRRGAHDLTFTRSTAQEPVPSRIRRRIVVSGTEAGPGRGGAAVRNPFGH